MADRAVADLDASDALAGTELFYADGFASAAAADVKVTAAQIKTWTSASPTLVTPNIGVASGTTLALAQGTITDPATALSVTSTWNDAADTFTGFKLNVTDTASANTSMPFDIQIGGASVLKYIKNTTGGGSGLVITAQTPNSQTLHITPRDGTRGSSSFRGGGQYYFDNIINAHGYYFLASGVTGEDLFLTRKAAATLQMGTADAASPVAQTIGVQSVVAGTSNTAGVDWTFKGSAGTGSATGGKFAFQYATHGTSGTSQNSYFNILRAYAQTASTRISTLEIGPTYTGAATEPQQSSLIMNAQDLQWVFTNEYNTFNIRSQGSPNSQLGNYPYKGFSTISTGVFAWHPTTSYGTPDTYLGRNAAASIRFGEADAAAPVAQTLGVQSVVAGTSNTAGVAFTIKGSASTGTGAGGSIIFQTTPAGGSGTSVNSYATVLTLDSTLSATFGVASTGTGKIKLAHASSAHLTTIQAGNAAAARTYTWPTNFGAAGSVLSDAAGDGTLSWETAPAAGAGGNDTEVQFNDAGSLNGDTALTWNKTTNALTVGGTVSLGTTNALTCGSVELGHASDTTLARVSAGVASIEGNNIITAANAATQAEQETGSSTAVFVSPGRQHFHVSAAKFWVYWTGASTTILKSYNMDSIANTGTGDADGTITTDFSDANWAGFVCTNDAGTDGWDADSIQSCGFNARAAGTFGVLCGFIIDGGTAAAALTNPDQWQAIGFGDHA